MLKRYGVSDDVFNQMIQRPLNVPHETKEHREVITDVIWYHTIAGTVPIAPPYPFGTLEGKPKMKMTLEWEE